MQVGDVCDQLQSVPRLDTWPEVDTLFSDRTAPIRLDWKLPIYSIQAVNRNKPDPLPLVSALACLQMSIILIDDILDNDPRGKHLEMGTGRAANLALALQSAAHLLVQKLDVPATDKNLLSTSLQRMAFQTTVGQEIDVHEILDEAAYWNLVQAKSTPFYGTALEIGALAAGAPTETCAAIYRVGAIFGEIIQIMDDITDAFLRPAKPDWTRQNNNLIILYAKTARHPAQQRFLAYLTTIDTPGILDEAQNVLIESGAVSYGVYQIIDRFEEACSILQTANVDDSMAITKILYQQIAPLRSFLAELGLDIPSTLQQP